MSRPSMRILYWLMTFVVLFVGSLVVAFGVFTLLDRALGATELNVWGDIEGLVLPFWIFAGVLFVVSLAVVIRYFWNHSNGSGAA